MRWQYKTTALAALFLWAGCGGSKQDVRAAQPQPLLAPAPGSPIAVAPGPGNVAFGDANDDGKTDLVVVSGRSQTITVLLGQGDGQFRVSPTGPVLVEDYPGEMALGDINGDSNLDLAFASHDSYAVTVLLGDGNGDLTLAPGSPVPMKDGEQPHTHGLALGDMNGDGNLDLVTANNADDDIAVAFGDGFGGFSRAAGSPFAVGKAPYPLALGDLDSDGHLDVVATSTSFGPGGSSDALTVLLGDGRGGFRRNQVPGRASDPWFVTIGDVNGDRKPDLVTTHWERSELTILLGDGSGSFTEVSGSPFDLGQAAWGACIADINGDGKVDVVAAAGDGVCLMLGDGQGGFAPASGSPYPTDGGGAWRIAVGDINGDGKPDVATSNVETDNVTVLLAR